jgi:hypothetical protein
MGPDLAYQVVMETYILPIVANDVVMKPLACKVLPVKRTNLLSSPSLNAPFLVPLSHTKIVSGNALLNF